MKYTLIFIKIIALLAVVIAVIIGVVAFIKPGVIRSKVNHYYKKNGFKPSETAVWGVDLSHHQGKVNWDKVEEQKPRFAFLKVTEGSSHLDRKYKKYLKEIRSRNILVGSYHFFSYSSKGKKQAEHFIKHISLEKGDLPPVLDAENKRRMPDKSKITKELLAFIETVETALKVKPIIYCTERYYNKYLKGKLSGTYVLWICDFRNEPKSDYHFWQKSDKLDLPGFRSLVDYNIYNGSYKELTKLTIK
jgi:lysozyme